MSFTGYGEDKKCRLETCPAPGLAPPKLPKWLRIPYLKPRRGFLEPRLILEKNLNTHLQPGNGLWQQGLNGHLEFDDGSNRSVRSEEVREELTAEKGLERVRMDATLEQIRANSKACGERE